MLLLPLICFVHSAHAQDIRALRQVEGDNAQKPANGRSALSITWSCLGTIFLCTWVSVHPNIPAAGVSTFGITLKRLKLMLVALLAPELVQAWAMRQWIGARWLTRQYQTVNWTMDHSFFLMMGGFHLSQEGTNWRLLSAGSLLMLDESKVGKICKLATLRDIQDKSKSDFMAKGLALVQTTWFIGQCITRGVRGLAMTELELLTVALAALNGTMYFFWWAKPLDVRTPILLSMEQLGIVPEDIGVSREISAIIFNDSTFYDRDLDDVEVDISSGLAYLDSRAPIRRLQHSAHIPSHSNSSVTVVAAPLTESKGDGAISPSKLTWRDCFLHLLERLRGSYARTFHRPFISMMVTTESFIDIEEAKYVPQFYCFRGEDPRLKAELRRSCIFVGTVGVLFGSLHLLAWSFVFPNRASWLVWQVSSISIVASSLFFVGWLLLVVLGNGRTAASFLAGVLISASCRSPLVLDR